MCVSANADVRSVVFGDPLGFASHDSARFMRERQPRQANEGLQVRVRPIHVGTDHGQRDFMPGLVSRDLKVSRAQALVIGFRT
jgi:hypothetical protein